jgi:hypothetical protein
MLQRDPILPFLPQEMKLAKQLVLAGYKKLATTYHPDKGGKLTDMQRLNVVKEKLLRCMV